MSDTTKGTFGWTPAILIWIWTALILNTCAVQDVAKAIGGKPACVVTK